MLKASDLPPDLRARLNIPTESKYKVKSKDTRTCDGITFHSKAEMHYYRQLKRERDEFKTVLYFLRQVPIHLPGNTKYVVDFVVFLVGHTEPKYIDVKGCRTAAFIKAKKQVEALYPIKIQEIK